MTVTLSPAGQHGPASQHSEVEVTYELTALNRTAEHKLAEFADGYPAYLRSWQDAIAALLREPGHGAAAHGNG